MWPVAATLCHMIGKLRSTVLDCPDPSRLADFYAAVLGGLPSAEEDDWVVLTDPGGRRLAFQRAPAYEPPQFPDPRGSQQFHLDIEVDDIEVAERKVLALGATRVPDADEDDTFRVYRDPVGHTFCLVWSVLQPDPISTAGADSGV
jgi:catechol 2,3-dioxygenase-like lactoylglutathione lyase family enzyme